MQVNLAAQPRRPTRTETHSYSAPTSRRTGKAYLHASKTFSVSPFPSQTTNAAYLLPLTPLSVSTVASSSAPAGFEITFVDIAEKDKAAQGVVKSQAMPIKVLDGSTRFFTPGVDASNPSGPQPVTLEAEQQNFGQLFQLGNELRLGSTDPPFNSWIICDGAGETNHPVLKWLGAPNNVVQSQRGCDFVRLYVESPSG